MIFKLYKSFHIIYDAGPTMVPGSLPLGDKHLRYQPVRELLNSYHKSMMGHSLSIDHFSSLLITKNPEYFKIFHACVYAMAGNLVGMLFRYNLILAIDNQLEMTILHVDDDFEEREIFSEALLSIDSTIKFVGAYSASNAFSKLQDSSLPDIIFVDINMPMVNGFQFLENLKQSERFSLIPVFVYSTSKTEEDVSTSLKLGAVKYIVKPNDFKTLKEILREIISQNPD